LNVDDKKSLKKLIKKDNEELSLIGSTVNESIFPRIRVVESSKQGCDILKKTNQGVVVAKFQTLMWNFENENMYSNESTNEYIKKMKYRVNYMRSLGEDILETRLLEKILRSVFPKFHMVTTGIIVSKDLNMMKIDELSGYFLTIEESNPTMEMEHDFSTRNRRRGRSMGKY
jgi:hypothetical protein